jgi:hypothetical protein
MSESDPCESRVAVLERRVAELEKRLMTTDLRQAALVASWFPAKSKRERKRVLAEMKAVVRVHRTTLTEVSGMEKAAAEDFIDGMKRMRKSLKA